MQHLSLPAETAGADPRAIAQLLQRNPVPADQRVPGIFASRNRENLHADRQTGGDILHTMDCKVDLTARQGLFNLLHKKPLAADHRQWRIQDSITGGLDAFQRYQESRLQFAQAVLYPFSLPDGQGAPACPDDQLTSRLSHCRVTCNFSGGFS